MTYRYAYRLYKIIVNISSLSITVPNCIEIVYPRGTDVFLLNFNSKIKRQVKLIVPLRPAYSPLVHEKW